jgi:hypothetical protein
MSMLGSNIVGVGVLGGEHGGPRRRLRLEATTERTPCVS